MATRDIVVVGASAGGVEALIGLVRQLPANFPAALFVALHLPADAHSALPEILSRAGAFQALHGYSGQPWRKGKIYIAPPDHHLLLRDGRILLSRGPKENAHRPAIDTMFRSAAVHGGARTIGIVLSGSRDDGTAGLKAIKECGGLAVVQLPNEALFRDMPSSAIENVAVDHVVRIAEMGPLLARLTNEQVGPSPRAPAEMIMEDRVAAMEQIISTQKEPPGEPSVFTCPECDGVLFEYKDGEMVRYRCRVGHAYSADTLGGEQSKALEAGLWSAMAALKEKAAFARRMVDFMEKRGHEAAATRYRQEFELAKQRTEELQRLLESTLPMPVASEMPEPLDEAEFEKEKHDHSAERSGAG
jgi:two-component system chemotaxis response regulator CheB